MIRLVEIAKKAALKIKSSDNIEIVSHFDCDGIASAAIMTNTLRKLGKKFHTTIIKQIDEKIIEELNRKNCELVIFTDLGSGYLNEIKKLKKDVIIADHHTINSSIPKNIIHINPEEFSIKSLSGSCVTYLIARELDNKTMSVLAIVGAIGDLQEYEYGLNQEILKEAESFGLKRQIGLSLFGRKRPLYKSLQYFDLETISSESSAIQFLSKTGIEIRNGNKWKTLNDLSFEETQKLSDKLIQEALMNGKNEKDIFREIYMIGDTDVRELATLLNACGRLEEYETAIGVCLQEKEAEKKSELLMSEYRSLIGKYLSWVEKNIKKMPKTENTLFIKAGNMINENMIGTIVSIYSKSPKNKKDVVIGMANSGDSIKISARSSKVDMNNIISECAEKVGGIGGGHKKAAGAIIPKGKENDFINFCKRMIENNKSL